MISRTSPPNLRLHGLFAILICCVSGLSTVNAQQAAVTATANSGIRFTDDKWNDVLKQARKSGKLIFVDCYTTWCGPCSYMSKYVFTDAGVGSFFNDQFISKKMNMETRAGIDFAEMYDIPAYPTLFLIDGSGKVVSKEVGLLDADGLRSFAEKGLAMQKQLASANRHLQSTIAFRGLSWSEVKRAAQQEGKLIFIDENPYDSASGYLESFYYDTATVARLNRDFICWKYVATDYAADSSGKEPDEANIIYLDSYAGYGSWNYFYSPEGSPLITWDSNSDTAAMAGIFEQLNPCREIAQRYKTIYPLIERYAKGERKTNFLKTFYVALNNIRPENTTDPLLVKFSTYGFNMQHDVARQLLTSASGRDLRNDTLFDIFCTNVSFQEDTRLIAAFADKYGYFSKKHPGAAHDLALELYNTSFNHLSEYINKPMARAVRKLIVEVFDGNEQAKKLAAYDEMIKQTENYYRKQEQYKKKDSESL
jgi:thiol-disulfide isomerase/thioredoxin